LIQQKKSTNKKGLNTVTSDEKRMDEQLEEPQSSTLFETSKITKHKRRNSLDSTRGLSVKGHENCET
jgi:hypothetical protein